MVTFLTTVIVLTQVVVEPLSFFNGALQTTGLALSRLITTVGGLGFAGTAGIKEVVVTVVVESGGGTTTGVVVVTGGLVVTTGGAGEVVVEGVVVVGVVVVVTVEQLVAFDVTSICPETPLVPHVAITS